MNHIPKHIWITFSIMIISIASSIAYERYIEHQFVSEMNKALPGVVNDYQQLMNKLKKGIL